MTMVDDAILLMRLLGMEPYSWQREFWEEYCHAPYEGCHYQVDWERVLRDLDRMSQGVRRSGRTTALAIWLAVDPSLPDWERRPMWVNDHYLTQRAAEGLVRLAMGYKRTWSEFKCKQRSWREVWDA